MTIPGLPPALVLGLLLAAIATQVAYMIRPGPPSYGWRFAGAALALLLSEIMARLFLASRLSLGDLHPLLDLPCLALGQWILVSIAGRRGTPIRHERSRPSFKAELKRGM